MSPLQTDLQRLWDQYLSLERSGQRRQALALLDTFMDQLIEAGGWQMWARQLARSVADQHANIPVRMPLFRRVLLPALSEGIRNNEPGCARWLAHFPDLLVQLTKTDLPGDLRSQEWLLKEALRRDPEDRRALQQLIQAQAEDFTYTLHELPSGVLYGLNGASAEQCDELLAEVEEFKGHVQRTSQTGKYNDLIEKCLFHYSNYSKYLLTRRSNESYAEFLHRTAGFNF